MTLEARLAQLRAENHDESMAAAAERDALLRAVAESSEGNACLQNLVSCLQKGAEKRLAMATEEWQEQHSRLDFKLAQRDALLASQSLPVAAGVACLIVAQRRQVWSVAHLVVQMMHQGCRLERLAVSAKRQSDELSMSAESAREACEAKLVHLQGALKSAKEVTHV